MCLEKVNETGVISVILAITCPTLLTIAETANATNVGSPSWAAPPVCLMQSISPFTTCWAVKCPSSGFSTVGFFIGPPVKDFFS
ncbi:hypothetical protein HanPSC8_Chr13g0594321 [Helianthus annuus]|nr:hypothetical protein HanPSC8_Chr13g0594321 [Helianthus annuus]